MSKSTYIKDLKPKVNQTEPETPSIRISEVKNEDNSEADVTLNEIIDEVSVPVDKMPPQNLRPAQPEASPLRYDALNPNMFYKDAIAQREVTQQLQQQLLQQQLLQQQLLTNSMETKLGLGLHVCSSIKKMLYKELVFIVCVCILYVIFQNIDIISMLKIDKISFLDRIPFIKPILLTILFSLSTTILKTNV
tara:strand:+ start:701 stop:1276 length:576 start_codon:yes stop_codon:yes gene_type:complete